MTLDSDSLLQPSILMTTPDGSSTTLDSDRPTSVHLELGLAMNSSWASKIGLTMESSKSQVLQMIMQTIL